VEVAFVVEAACILPLTILCLVAKVVKVFTIHVHHQELDTILLGLVMAHQIYEEVLAFPVVALEDLVATRLEASDVVTLYNEKRIAYET
jgi:hypothetical protein